MNTPTPRTDAAATLRDWNTLVLESTTLETELAEAKAQLAETEAHNEFLQDTLSAFEWQRINTMSVAEVEKELHELGYTKERLDAGFAKIRATVAAALAKQKIQSNEPAQS
jgi:hypothetical protein